MTSNQAPAAPLPPGADRRTPRPDTALDRLRRVLGRSSSAPEVLLGQLLLLSAGTVLVLTAPLLDHRAGSLVAVAVAAAVMAATLVVSTRLPWDRLPRQAALALPALLVASLVALRLTGSEVMPYAPFWVLAFAVTGLTQGATTNWVLLVPAVVSYAVAVGSVTAPFAVRLVIVTAVWALVAQLLVRLTAEQRRLAGDLRSEARTDALTGLANRRDLDRRLQRLAVGDAVVICDLDHFKALNDRWGHVAGDRVLADFGLLLRVALREQDYGARYGGEEFALVLPRTGPAQARAVVERLRERWHVLQPGTTFSAGTATLTTAGRAAELVAAADAALYAAKAAGRDCARSAEDAPAPAGPPPTADQAATR